VYWEGEIMRVLLEKSASALRRKKIDSRGGWRQTETRSCGMVSQKGGGGKTNELVPRQRSNALLLLGARWNHLSDTKGSKIGGWEKGQVGAKRVCVGYIGATGEGKSCAAI